MLVVGARIRGQRRLLLSLRDTRPRARYAVSRALRLLTRLHQGLRQHATVDALRGAEGAAARVFFAGWTALLPTALRFPGRRRRPPTDPVNAALSLGYSLLHARVLEACHATGLDAAIGVLHAPEHGRPSLACDLVEFERAAVEHWVRSMFVEGRLRASDFERSDAGCLLAKSGRGAFFAGIEPVLAAAQRRTRRRLHALLRWLDANAGAPEDDDAG
jgi:CRISPR-associated protein Cas1